MRALLARIRSMFSRRTQDAEFEQEVASHLAMLIEENMRRGMNREDATAAARRSFGALTQIKESHRDARGFPLIEGFFKDVRFAARMLCKHPGFTLVAMITLALGIGLNTTVFTAFNAVALKPLPVRDPYGVVRLERWFKSGSAGDIQYAFSYPEYLHFAQSSHALSSLVATSWPVSLSATLPDGAVESVDARLVSANFFDELGIRPFLGRAFSPAESRGRASEPVVVLSYRFWQQRFQSDPHVLNAQIKINRTSFTVVGIAPEEFIGTGVPATTPDFWTLLSMESAITPGQDWLDDANQLLVQILARPQPGVSYKQVQAEATVLIKQFAQQHPFKDKTLQVTAGVAHLLPNTNDPSFQATVYLIMLIVAMVLFIACANLANMLLARSSARHQELSVRLALGASRARLIRQLLIESSMLALLGGLAGFLISIWSTKFVWLAMLQILRGPFNSSAAFVVNLSPDLRVLTYALLLSLATGILFGLSPALRFSRPNLTQALKDEGTAFGQRLGRSKLRSFLVAGQIAVSLTLLIVAGLLARGLVRSQSVDPGYDARSIYLLSANFGDEVGKSLDLEKRIVERLRELPQIHAVTLTANIPMAGTHSSPIETQDTRLGNFSDWTLIADVAPEYFDTMGISILNGRNFTHAETGRKAHVALVSEQTALRMWPDEDPLGRRFRIQNFAGRRLSDKTEYEVIGVVKSVRTATLSRIDPLMIYLPLAPGTIEPLLLRAQGDPSQAASSIRAAVSSIDPNLAASLLLVNLEEGPLRFQRVQASLFSMSALGLAGLALSLATVGIYGVMSFLVTQRTKEIGILMALGANRGDVLRSIILQGLRPVLFGSIIGLAGASLITSLVHSIGVRSPGAPDPLFGANQFDPISFVGLSALLALVAMLASAVPAYRALRIDPMIALRYE